MSILILLYCSVFGLINSNPLQGLPSYPVIQYEQNYGNELTIQPRDFNTYPQVVKTQNHLTPYQNIPTYNDYVQGLYVNNVLQNEINSAINTNYCEQNGPPVGGYVLNPTDLIVPNVITKYIVIPVESNPENIIQDCNKSCDVENFTNVDRNAVKKNKKCKKKKRPDEDIHENGGICSRDKETKNCIKSNKKEDMCSKSKCKKDSQRSSQTETDDIWDNKKLTNSKCLNSESNMKKKGLKGSDNDLKITESSKRVAGERKSKNCQKVVKNNDCYGSIDRNLEQANYFNINENCFELDNRCTRNYKEENVQKYHQPYHTPNYFYNMAPYNNMFNPQLFNNDFPYNFDYLYDMQQFVNANSNTSQKKPNNRKTSKRRKQKRGKKKKCDRINNSKNGGCENVVELSPILVEVPISSERDTSVLTQIEEPQIKNPLPYAPDTNGIKTKDLLQIIIDSKENKEDPFQFYDDYYPEFHSDNLYLSKEYDWDSFHDRHYYSSNDISDGRENRKDNDLDNSDTNRHYQTSNHYLKLMDKSIDNEGNCEEKRTSIKQQEVTNKGERDNDVRNNWSEEIQFRTPPVLDFPDFRTEMRTKPVDNNKMSAYSNAKKENDKINRIIDQNEVETDFGHSKVVKYGTPPNKEETILGILHDSDRYEENKPFHASIVIAKSLPYPI